MHKWMAALALLVTVAVPSYAKPSPARFDWFSHWNNLVQGADGTILSTKKAGGFVGAVLGVYAHDEPSGE